MGSSLSLPDAFSSIYMMENSFLVNTHTLKPFFNNYYFLLKGYSCQLSQNNTMIKTLTLRTLLFGET